MKSKVLIVSLLASAAFAGLGMSPAMAQTNTPRIDQAQQAVSVRIQQGLASGHITPYEAQMLIRRERDIRLREAQYKSNGTVTSQERQQLRNDLSVLSADVERIIASRNMARPPADAGNTPRVDRQEYEVSRRIEEGVRSGRITQREARRLQSRARETARHEAFFKSDGVVTQQERRQLRNELDALRDEVERLISNDHRGHR